MRTSPLDGPYFYLFQSLLVCGWFGLYGILEKNLLLGTAYSLILAGAIGNLIDRFRLSYVVDFIDFYIGNSHFPAFNIADSSISIAAGILIYDFILEIKEKREKSKQEDNTSHID